MTTSEFQQKTRAINARVYRVVMASWVAALVLSPLAVRISGRYFESQAPVFGVGLVVAVLVIGVPLFVALGWAGREYGKLQVEYAEEQRAETFQRYQAFLTRHKEEADNGRDEDKAV